MRLLGAFSVCTVAAHVFCFSAALHAVPLLYSCARVDISTCSLVLVGQKPLHTRNRAEARHTIFGIDHFCSVRGLLMLLAASGDTCVWCFAAVPPCGSTAVQIYTHESTSPRVVYFSADRTRLTRDRTKAR